MRERMFQTYKKLQNNTTNYFVYFEQGKRCVKTFSEFHTDVEECIAKLNYLKSIQPIENIAILGTTSYMWMVIDHACIKGGFSSVGIPETYSVKNIQKIYDDVKIDLTLCDSRLQDIFNSIQIDNIYYFNCLNGHENSLDQIQKKNIENSEDQNIIREDYTVVFSSGTSENVKKINWNFPEIEKRRTLGKKIRFVLFIIKYKLSFWSRSDNKVIIFMPFSHPINRSIGNEALLQKINVVISDPQNCLKHIITEKPNIMFAVPPVYEALAQNIKQRLNKFSGLNKKLFFFFNFFKINTLSNSNPIKRFFSFLLFKKIRKIYGGRADYFVTGSAPTNPDVLKTFYSVGVKVFEAYGQTESSNIMNDHKNFRIGSIGRPKKGMTKISDEGELLLKYEEKYHAENKEILKLDGDWICSGDLAYKDKDGFIFITGRKDDLIVLNNGKKVNPHRIEALFQECDEISHALIFTKDSLSISAIIDFTKHDESYISKGIKIIAKINSTLASYEQVRYFCMPSEHFTSENGLLTGTLKMKRKAIVEKYAKRKFEAVSELK